MLSTELLTYYRKLSQSLFTVVDVETTGRFADSDRVIEISVLQATLADGIALQRTDLINPQVAIPSNISRFTGIAQWMVDAAPTAADILPAYLPLLNTGVLTAHNVEFDDSFLQSEYQRLGTAFQRPVEQQLCTVQLSRLMLPDLPSRRLPYLVKHFQFDVGSSHRAGADTLACWLLTERLLTELLKEPDPVLLATFARQWMPLRVAATLLGCSSTEGRSRLEAAGVQSRHVGRGNRETWMYRRGDVERVVHEQDQQLRWS
ncbi:3'-5' exonuclease [Oculatella sp. LEGE 06141]|uniref:3'-5' exonuclease n=1 Tax=Oculatella sp. LEGE 06141 TaxID=1828648 RepID=UPI001D13DD87|nr:3'-5' exonuclease [Oculatella sp. LEGE 06141]